MSAPLAELESQWLAQMATMRQVIADLQLPPLQDKPYGADLQLDDGDVLTDALSDEIWETSTDTGERTPSDSNRDAANGLASEQPTEATYGPQWLQNRCLKFAQFRSGLSASDVLAQVTAVLASDSSEDELQMSLADVLGLDDLDFVIELIAHRREILGQTDTYNRKLDGILSHLQTREERELTLRQQDYE